MIGIQEVYFPNGLQLLHEPEAATAMAAQVLAHFRVQGCMCKHAFDQGAIHRSLALIAGKVVITKNKVNAFLGSKLAKALRSKVLGELVLTGTQSHMCRVAAVRAAKDHRFNCEVLSDACATCNLKFEYTESTSCADSVCPNGNAQPHQYQSTAWAARFPDGVRQVHKCLRLGTRNGLAILGVVFHGFGQPFFDLGDSGCVGGMGA